MTAVKFLTVARKNDRGHHVVTAVKSLTAVRKVIASSETGHDCAFLCATTENVLAHPKMSAVSESSSGRHKMTADKKN